MGLPGPLPSVCVCVWWGGEGAGKSRHHIPFNHIQLVLFLWWPLPAWERMWPLQQLHPNTQGTQAAGFPSHPGQAQPSALCPPSCA